MRFRRAMQPWVVLALEQLTLVVAFCGVFFAPGRVSRHDFWVVLIAGLLIVAVIIYNGQPASKRPFKAVAGLDKTRRSQAVAAVIQGAVPADSTVRNSAIRLGTAFLGGKSDAQLKRRERRSWLALALFAAAAIVAVTQSSNKYEGLFFLVLVLLLAVTLPLGVLTTRRIQRNVALLTEGDG
jgi:uncharacterized membrane protein YhaH (DUF805 family)